MEIISKKIVYGGDVGNRFRLYFLGDVHLGAKMVDKQALGRDLRQIADDPERNLVMLMGDMGDYIERHDKRFESDLVDWDIIPPDNLDALPELVIKKLIQTFEPIKDQIIGLHSGNHGQKDKTTHKTLRYDQRVAEGLGVAYLGYSAITSLKFEHSSGGAKRTVNIHSHHGYQGSRRSGGLINTLELEGAYYPTCDIIVRGHSHQLFGHRFSSIVPDQRNKTVRYRDRIVGHTGSYLRTLGREETYSERAGFRPSPVGCLKVWIVLNDESYELYCGE